MLEIAYLHCALSLAPQCVVIGPVCLCVCLWVCYHDNSKLRASIFTKLGEGSDHLQLIKFWQLCTSGMGLRQGEKFWLRFITASMQCLLFSERFFHLALFGNMSINNWSLKM